MADDGEPNNYIGVDLQAEPSSNLLPSQQPASSNTLSKTQMAEVVSAVVSELWSRGMIVTEKQNDIPVAQPARDNADLGVIENSVRNVFGLQNQDEPVLHVSGENPSTSAEERSPVQLPKGIPPLHAMHSYSVRPSAFIDMRTKQAIWNDEFVEFSDLLYPKNAGNGGFLIQFNGGNVSVSAPEKENKTQLSIGPWISAFHIYLDIYSSKYPHLTSDLIAYCNLIRGLERGYGVVAFNFYDRTFRAHN
jgi:hypothetical protein